MWPIFLELKQILPTRRFPVFAFISVLGTAFGVTALLVVQTVMFSFGEEHRRRIREANGDVVVESAGQRPIHESARIEERLKKTPGVEAVSPYVSGIAVYLSDNPGREFQSLPVFRLYGIEPEKAAAVYPFERYGAGETVREIDDDRIVLGKILADQNLRVSRGEQISVLSGTKAQRLIHGNSNAPAAEVRLPREFEVFGTVATKYRPADEALALTTLRTARELFDIPAGAVTGFALKLKNPDNADAVAAELNEKMPPALYARPWTQFHKAFLNAIAMEKSMLFLLMFIITIVASFSIGSTLFNHVVRRTREIGLLGALGSTPLQILKLFLAQGFFIGVAGYGLGVVFTFLIMTFRQEIIAVMGAGETLFQQYQFGEVPLYYNAGDFGKAAVLTVVLMTLASLLPAIWAARRKPSEAMRDVV